MLSGRKHVITSETQLFGKLGHPWRLVLTLYNGDRLSSSIACPTLQSSRLGQLGSKRQQRHGKQYNQQQEPPTEQRACNLHSAAPAARASVKFTAQATSERFARRQPRSLLASWPACPLTAMPNRIHPPNATALGFTKTAWRPPSSV